METPSEVDTTVGNKAVENEPDDMVFNSTQACSHFGALWSDEELIETPQRTIPVRPGHLWCGVGEADAAGRSIESDADYENPADENDTLATLKKQHLEILDRLDRLHDSLDILTRMSFRSESVPESIHPKGIGQVCSMKAEVGSMSVDLSPSSRSDASQEQPKKGEKTPVAARIRASFTPNLFSSFEQFDKSLKRVAARADSAHRKRKYASVRQKDSLKGAREGCLKRIVKHSGFDFFFAFVVLSNSIFIGVEVQLGLEIQGSRPLAIYIFQYAYTFLFSVELGLRLLADWRFYLCDEWMWTWLDIFIVLSSLWELAVDLIYVWSGSQAAEPERFAGVINLKALRVIRVTRIVKAVRLMRIFRFVMALRTLITSILHTLQSLFWALALLVLIVYVFAVLFVQAVQDHILDPDNPALPERDAGEPAVFLLTAGHHVEPFHVHCWWCKLGRCSGSPEGYINSVGFLLSFLRVFHVLCGAECGYRSFLSECHRQRPK